jgi:hypothetical protein
MKKDLQHLAPDEAKELLALAAMAIRAREARRGPTTIWVHLEGSEFTPQAVRAAVHDLLETRRSERGIEHVDLRGLAEYG